MSSRDASKVPRLDLGGLGAPDPSRTPEIAHHTSFNASKYFTAGVLFSPTMDSECKISATAYVLLCLDEMESSGVGDLARQFCGRVVRMHDRSWTGEDVAATVFVCGDLARCPRLRQALAIDGLSYGEAAFPIDTVSLGHVPVLVHGVGVFFRGFFTGPGAVRASAAPGGLFGAVTAAHEFQELTESNKPGVAFRRGVYLSDVVPQQGEGEEPELGFNLLRCSSNLSGPTQGFEDVDRAVLAAVNSAAKSVFGGGAAPINHVLAQVYRNTAAAEADPSDTVVPADADKLGSTEDAARNMPEAASTEALPASLPASDAAAGVVPRPATPQASASPLHLPEVDPGEESTARSASLFASGGRERKAAIKAHSDKTKDMPASGVLAFCSFYESFEGGAFHGTHARLRHPTSDPFDYCVSESYGRGASALTMLHFRLKRDVRDATLAREFTVTLYPDSLLLIPLSTNRLYTHEIRPSVLPIRCIPTRLGYVARCSKTRAVYSSAAGTRVVAARDRSQQPLVPGSAEDFRSLRSLYFAENTSSDVVHYGDAFGDVFFSMNGGDFLAPTLSRT